MSEVHPLWHVAKVTGRTVQELSELCDNERIIDCEWRKTPSGGVWWAPCPPIILDESGNCPVLTTTGDGMLPLWAIAKRDGVKPDALARMCGKGRVSGARKVGGCWYIPTATIVSAPRRGRPSPMVAFPEWLAEPPNGS